MTLDFDPAIRAIKEILERPNAERPYLDLEKAYREIGMVADAEAVLFLVNRRFGKNDNNPDCHEKQRKND